MTARRRLAYLTPYSAGPYTIAVYRRTRGYVILHTATLRPAFTEPTGTPRGLRAVPFPTIRAALVAID